MSVATKNPFAYLGNDSDGEEKPVVPVKTVDKAPTNTTKRNTEPSAPLRSGGAGGNRRGGPRGNEGAFRDRGAGSDRNHQRGTDEAPRDGPRGGYGARARGGRGGRRPREGDDRHASRSGATIGGGSEKTAAQAWGATEGEAELKDEQAGEAIAQSEAKDAQAEDAAPEEPAEPEDKSVSYADYLVQQAEKKAALDTGLAIRSANEGSKLDKKWASAKPIEKEGEEDFIIGTYGKKQRERERKTKQTVDFDPRFVEPERTRGGRGGRGGPRGGRGGERGRGSGGFPRGGSGNTGNTGGRGGPANTGARGGRENAPINTRDESAFPSLGGK